MNEIILIGGAPTVGKTYTARRLAKKLNLPWISTDGIRGMMRKVVDEKRFPHLFKNVPHLAAEEYLAKYSSREIVDNQIIESIDVWQGVKAFIDTDYAWKSFIVEGVAVLPEFIDRDLKNDQRIKPMFLVNSNEDQVRKVVYTRGLYDDADTYSDDVKEKEVEWALMFNDWIKKEAKKYNYPVYEIVGWDFGIDEILKKLI